MAKYNLNEALKAREARLKQAGQGQDQNQEMALDDVARVKVLSPGRKVFKRFIRNRLAVFGSVTLIVLFIFSFLGPLFYPYGQKQIFYRYDTQNVNYGLAKVNTTYTGFDLADGVEIARSVDNSMNSSIKAMQSAGSDVNIIVGDSSYTIRKYADNIYMLNEADLTQICTFGSSTIQIGTYDSIKKTLAYTGDAVEGLPEALAAANIKGKGGQVEFGGVTYQLTKAKGKSFSVTAVYDGIHYAGQPMDAAFETAVNTAAEAGEASFEFNGKTYILKSDAESHLVYELGTETPARVYSCYSMDFYETGLKASNEFRREALLAAGSGNPSGTFQADGRTWTYKFENDVFVITDDAGAEYAEFTTFAIRRYSGEDTMAYDLKKAISNKVQEMLASDTKKDTLVYNLPMQGSDGKYVYDENGQLQYQETEMVLTRRDTGEFVINADQVNYVIDMFSKPSAKHIMGTDGDGFDVLARIMYGGRISLMVGFVVVFLELLLGVIMGGIAGFYGGWVDNLIMRLVDIFYCLPSMPIMIIIGAVMDALRMDTYIRLLIMMAALGIMGWAGVARLVRGQILSLREQEFMIAAEATGIKVRARIFRHLVPNVMPQLIVTATMGVGGVILTESTLSFLGLGVKHPLATWGTIINSVSSASAMAHYAHIWIPVGLLICLTVIAFNFVGDGLRDAYDPKAKR